MVFVEVVVNVPIRRITSRGGEPLPAADSPGDDDDRALQTFHYHLPANLEEEVVAGHLVWAPFGHQAVQGVVLRRSDTAPVTTKAILRLARPDPVLTAVQIELAEWIATYYVASFAEAVKLFLPPGLLARTDGTVAVRAKRELRVRLAMETEHARQTLVAGRKTTPQGAILGWLLTHADEQPLWATLKAACNLRSRDALHSLVQRELIRIDDDHVSLAVSPAIAQDACLALSGADKYIPVIEVLAAAGGELWRSELNAATPVDLALLRALQAAGVVELNEQIRMRDPLAGRTYARTKAPALTSEQRAVWQPIAAAFTAAPLAPAPLPFLLHGVTGSGKTEIYLHAIAETLARGRQAIVLVPGIALTPQTVARFAGRFPGHVTVIHSELSAGERYDVWRAVRDGLYDVIVGPRSALFAPLARLGLIVIDEEHESTYKQDAEEWGSFNVFYDARRVARKLADLTNSLLIMGSATPSLETYYLAEQGELTLLQMPRRVLGHQAPSEGETQYAELPPVEIVDMRQELRAGHRSIFSRSLTGELLATLDAGQQAILFLNRRGTHTFVLCRDCGHVEECRRCESPLTYHEGAATLICHHCNRRYPLPIRCPQCQSSRIKYFGAGTERIEEAVQEIAPRARVLRWDADTTSRKGAHEEIMRAFAAHEADVMVGTQMIAKGLDLPLVTLVGVIAADTGLFLPDFRSSERTFQLLTQVAGRAGRSARGGRVIIQSYRPEHHAIQAAAQHDYGAFYRREIAFRREHAYPPLQRLARLIFWQKNAEKAKRESMRLAVILRQRVANLGIAASYVDVLGPAPAFFERFRGYYRWQILLRAPDPAIVLRGMDFPIGWRIDIDPASIL